MDCSRSKPGNAGRRHFLSVVAALELASFFRAAGEVPRQPVVIVVFVSGIDAYLEAVSGLRAGLAALVPSPLFIDLKAPQAEGALTDALSSGQQRVVVTVGTEALTTVTSRKGDTAIIPTMILRADRPRGSQAAAAMKRPPAVYLDPPLAALMADVRVLLPGKTRFGMIRNPERDEPDPSLPGRARQQGFTLHVAECSRPEDLVKSFLSLKGKADFVLLLADSSLYNNTTVRPLILASLENGLPIIGFSPSFVRAGAAAGIYPDFRDIGMQTADMVQRQIAGKTGMADESPHKLQVAVNQRVLRLLGLACNETGAVVFK